MICEITAQCDAWEIDFAIAIDARAWHHRPWACPTLAVGLGHVLKSLGPLALLTPLAISNSRNDWVQQKDIMYMLNLNSYSLASAADWSAMLKLIQELSHYLRPPTFIKCNVLLQLTLISCNYTQDCWNMVSDTCPFPLAMVRCTKVRALIHWAWFFKNILEQY